MKFLKDILLIDFETTGLDVYEVNPIQLGAVLLDRATLEEKDSFVSFIKADLAGVPEEVRNISGITQEQLDTAPPAEKVAADFLKQFGTDVLLASWLQRLDRMMLDKIMRKSGYDHQNFGYHYLDLWPLAYVYLLKQGYSGDPHSEPMFQAFGLSERGNHEALDDCRREAQILRKILQA